MLNAILSRFQAQDSEERERWIRALEVRGSFDYYNSFYKGQGDIHTLKICTCFDMNVL